jgi:hypothetical protein
MGSVYVAFNKNSSRKKKALKGILFLSPLQLKHSHYPTDQPISNKQKQSEMCSIR